MLSEANKDLRLTKYHHIAVAALMVAGFASVVFPQSSRVPAAADRAAKLRQANALRLQAKALFDEGDAKKLQLALPKYETAKKLYHQLGDQEKHEATCLAAAGYGLSLLGYRQPALLYYTEALRLSRDANDDAGVAETLGSIGRIYFQLAENNEALKYYSESLKIYEGFGDRHGQARILTAIGASYFDLDDKPKALAFYDSALPFRKGDPRGEAITLYRIGRVYLDLKDTPAALDYLARSLSIRERIDDKRGIAESLIYIAWARISSGETEKAPDLFRTALENATIAGDKPRQAKAFYGLQTVSLSLGSPQLAIFYGKQMVNLYQDVRDGIRDLDSEAQASYLKTVETAYRKLAEIMISKGRLEEAQAVLDLIKGEEFADISRDGVPDGGIPFSKAEKAAITKTERLPELVREQSELRKQQRQQGDKFSVDKAARLDHIAAAIKTANADCDTTLAELGRSEPTVADRVKDIQSEQNLQSALVELGHDMKTGVVALYTVLGTGRTASAKEKTADDAARSKFGWVILVTTTYRRAYPIDVKDLEQNVFKFRAALASPGYDPRPLAKKIYDAIFRQTSAAQKTTLEADLQDVLAADTNKTIMWSLDGVLRYIPVAALDDGTGYLVQKYRNVVFTHESLLWLTKQPRSDCQTLGLGVSAGNSDLNLSALPGVDKELADIIRQSDEHTGLLTGTRKVNKRFSVQELLNLKDADNGYQRVHIASHFSFNPADQNASYLLTGDGKLTFGDMKVEKNLFGTVDLLTLSACDTGLSGNGKESEGFAYLAQSLGAKSVIASLWKVSDAGTPELMMRFYKRLADDPTISKGEAFRQAQLSLLTGSEAESEATGERRAEPVGKPSANLDLPLFVTDDKHPYAHPFYWASFVLIGNWR